MVLLNSSGVMTCISLLRTASVGLRGAPEVVVAFPPWNS